MLENFRAIAKEKGQGIVEYAILLAFIVGLTAMLMNAGGIKDAVIDTFDRVANFIALTTPEGRLAADKARIKKLGESLAANFKKNGVENSYQNENAVDLRGNHLSILVLPDGSMNLWCDGKWFTELNGNELARYQTALQNAGLDISNVFISDTGTSPNKSQYVTDPNYKLYSSGDEGGLTNGYAISFYRDGNEMKLRYYELNNPYKSEDLGTTKVPRSWLANGKSNDNVDDGGAYPNVQTKDLEF